jgi:hypothetical protein
MKAHQSRPIDIPDFGGFQDQRHDKLDQLLVKLDLLLRINSEKKYGTHMTASEALDELGLKSNSHSALNKLNRIHGIMDSTVKGSNKKYHTYKIMELKLQRNLRRYEKVATT